MPSDSWGIPNPFGLVQIEDLNRELKNRAPGERGQRFVELLESDESLAYAVSESYKKGPFRAPF